MASFSPSTPLNFSAAVQDLEDEIQQKELSMEEAKKAMEVAEEVFEKYRYYASSHFSEMEEKEYRQAQSDYATAQAILQKGKGELDLLQVKLQDLQIGHGAPSSVKNKDNLVARSSIGPRNQELIQVEENLIKLKYDYYAEDCKLQDLMEDTRFELGEPGLPDERKTEISRELQKLEKDQRKLKRDYDREFGKLNDQYQLQVRKVEFDSGAQAMAYIRKEDHHQSFRIQDSKPPPKLTENKVKENAKIWNGHPGSEYCDSDPGSTMGVVDKDVLVVQLLQKQMDLMDKAESSRGDKYLPEFNGDPSQWGNFKATYDRIQKRYRMDNSEAMTRLQKVIKGKARTSVEHLMANVSNVDKIMDTLELRFGRAEFVLDYLVEKAKTCSRPDITKPESIVEFGTSVEALVANIHAYKEDDYLHNKQLVTELVDKLPGRLKECWYEWLDEDSKRKRNLEFFAQWIKKRVKLALYQIKPTVAVVGGSETKRRPTRGPGAQNSSAVSEEKEERTNNTCNVCQRKKHNLDRCWAFQKKSDDEKWKIAKAERVCYGCLRPGHMTTDCKTRQICGENGCQRYHHKLLHGTGGKNYQSSDNQAVNQSPPPTAVLPQIGVEATTSSSTVKDENTNFGTIGVAVFIEGTDGPLAIVPVRVCKQGVGTWKTTYALLDSGATRTLVSDVLADELGLEGPRITYRYKNMGSELKVNTNARKVSFDVSGRYHNAPSYQLTNVVTVSEIGIPPYSININEIKRKWPHLKRMKGQNLKEVVPEIIIGGDHAFLHAHRELLMTNINQPVAMRTVLGWVIQGKFNVNTGRAGISYYVGGIEEDDSLHALVKESFKLDDYGIKPSKQCYSVEDKKAEEIMNSTAVKQDGRWTIGLLWKDENDSLPTDESQKEALRRLLSTEKRMRKDSQFAEVYKNKIKEYLDKGFIRKLSVEEAAEKSKKTFYISHFGVTNPNKPGKFRLVFDAAANISGRSFNDSLFTGPDLINNLLKILWNFRIFAVVIMGDIEDMYHRIFVQEKDRCAQRFLWRDGDSSRNVDIYEMLVLVFGDTSSQASAIYIKDRNADEYEKRYPHAVHSIKEHMYSDDLLSGANSISEAIKLRQEISTVMEAGGFHLKKFLSNSPEVMESIPKELRVDAMKPQNVFGRDMERVLGMWWNPADDTFNFKINFHKVDHEVIAGRKPSKREMCSLLMSLFDPIGFLSCYKIRGMILLQRVWRSGVDWDEDIPEELYEEWKFWLMDLPKIEDIRIPRCYSQNLRKAIDVQLHTLVDSSEEGFCAVSYLRIKHEDGVDVAFVSSKVRVSPLKKITIPRLELQAALLGTKLAKQIRSDLEVNINKFHYWSDSSTVLAWIKSTTGRFKEFVANRVGFIQEHTNTEDWHWIPTKENVADDATRSGTTTNLSNESRWFQGPEFLKWEPDCWPEQKKINEEESSVVATTIGLELIGDATGVSHSTDERCGLEAGDENGTLLPKFSKFSSYYRLLRASAAVQVAARHWIKIWKKERVEFPPWELKKASFESYLTSADILNAEKKVLKKIQEAFRTTDGKNKLIKIQNLKVIEDEDGLLRVKGRITNADVGDEVKNPILLPSKHHVVDLIVDLEHQRNAHSGKETVFNNLRRKYWITGGRNAVRRCFAKCNYCKIARARPVVPEMGDLPSYRLAAYNPPFSFCGVDFFGPVEITVGRRHEKRWVALFTCMVTRAVYLDIASGLSADEMMMVLCRFVDTNGLPQNMYSDNATNFKAVDKELNKKEKFCGMKWNFIPPASPHFGGAWERMVGAVKKVLWNIVKDKFPKEEVLRTALKAAENIVNSRPLTYVSGDFDDPEALTPNHLLRGRSVMGSGVLDEDINEEAERMRIMYKKAQWYANSFWLRWTQEVLPNLARRTKWYESREPVRVGDVVLLVDDQQPRNSWTKGIVTRAFPGKDGLVRVVEVTTRYRSKGVPVTYKRAVAKVVPLGLRVEDSATIPTGSV